MRYILSIILNSAICFGAQAVLLSDTLVNFPNTFSHQVSYRTVKITNTSAAVLKVKIYSLNPSLFALSDSVFNIPVGQTDSVQLAFRPIHNIFYHAELILIASDDSMLHQHVHLTGQGQYTESYYKPTENKSEQELKNILKTILAKNYNSLGYNAARDKMYMTIDNKATNGQGATFNTLECVYTGRQIVGYVSRQDAQSATYDFNTEHTWPQSLFSSSDPMVSDLHHLFPTDNAANNKRGNDPFGLVTSPSWQVGGSKSVSGLFEPRDQQKGATARAMLYFAVRYQNYSKYLNSQENILKQWHQQFPPSTIDSTRNESIYAVQKNRNPFVDHPELVDRISSFSDSSYAQADSNFSLSANHLNFFFNINEPVKFFRVFLSNTGNIPLILGSFKSDTASINVETSNTLVQPGFSTPIYGSVKNKSALSQTNDTIWFQYGGIDRFITYSYNSQLSINGIATESPVQFYPNPADEKVIFSRDASHVALYSLEGALLLEQRSGSSLFLSDLKNGIYMLRVNNTYHKLIIHHQ